MSCFSLNIKNRTDVCGWKTGEKQNRMSSFHNKTGYQVLNMKRPKTEEKKPEIKFFTFSCRHTWATTYPSMHRADGRTAGRRPVPRRLSWVSQASTHARIHNYERCRASTLFGVGGSKSSPTQTCSRSRRWWSPGRPAERCCCCQTQSSTINETPAQRQKLAVRGFYSLLCMVNVKTLFILYSW